MVRLRRTIRLAIVTLPTAVSGGCDASIRRRGRGRGRGEREREEAEEEQRRARDGGGWEMALRCTQPAAQNRTKCWFLNEDGVRVEPSKSKWLTRKVTADERQGLMKRRTCVRDKNAVNRTGFGLV